MRTDNGADVKGGRIDPGPLEICSRTGIKVYYRGL